MRALYPLLLLFFVSFASSANADWACRGSTLASNPQACAASSGATPESFLSSFVNYVSNANTNSSYSDYEPTKCQLIGTELANCTYTYKFSGSVLTSSISLQKQAAVCPPTLESRGPDSAIIKSGQEYYIVWKTDSVTSDICHNSCSYLASSASTSTCYFSPGSTNTGFCNFFVALNAASPSCVSESGYTTPGSGDPLTRDPDPDDGDDGADPGDDDGNNGGGDGGNNGGDGGSSFDGELSFSSPGALDTQSILDSESNSLSYQAYVGGMQARLNESEFGKAFLEFRENVAVGADQGVCPTAEINILQTVISFDYHCVLFAEISPILSIVFIAGWSLLAVRIFLSA